MKCPYCAKEMEVGYLQSARPIFWAKKKKKLIFKPTAEDEFEVSEGFLNGCFAEAYVCPACGKVILSVGK